jgi:excisionase family DNA binding protein
MTKSATTAEPEDFLTVSETAQYLRLCERQVRRLIARGDLPSYRFGTALRIKRRDIEIFTQANRIDIAFGKQYR